MAEPRSTWRKADPSSEQNLSLVPPDTDPLTALSGVSLALQVGEPVAGRFSARFPDGGGGGGGGGGGVLPLSYDGGASPGPVPQLDGFGPSVKSTVPPVVNIE